MEARVSWNSSCSACLTQASPPCCCCCCTAKRPSVRRRLDASGSPVMSTVPSLTGKSRRGVRQPHTPHWGSWEHRELYSCLLKALLAPPTGGHIRSPAPHSLRSLLPQNSATSLCPSPPHVPPAAYCPLGSQPLKRLSLRPCLQRHGASLWDYRSPRLPAAAPPGCFPDRRISNATFCQH